jgi:hypothetical protein
MGTPTSRRAYGTWAGRLVSPATIVTRFGTWAHALDLARVQELDAAPWCRVRAGVSQ